MANNTARRRKAENWRADAGLQVLQLSVLHVVNVPEIESHWFFIRTHERLVVGDEQAPESTAVLPPFFTTHFVHKSNCGKSCDGQTLVAVPVKHLMAWAEETRTMAKMVTRRNFMLG
jgi:hypothetical protein